MRCPASDAAAAADIVVDVLDSCDRFKEIGLCLGTKPHAIGFAIAALIRQDFTLVCRLPDRYVETETPATGIMWSYELRDFSVAVAQAHGGRATPRLEATKETDNIPD